MCTVSVVPLPDGFSLACNRDERSSRPCASEPAAYDLRPRRAIFPRDPVGGGTWMGVNDLGLAVALLNRASARAATLRGTPKYSRGLH